jgi:hypothetical protein
LPGLLRHPVKCLAVCAVLAQAGCSKDEIKAKLEEAQTKLEQVAESTVQAVEDKLPEKGSIKLDMTPPAVTSQADVELISIGDGRPNVVRIVSYDPSQSTRAYPAILLQGTTTIDSATALANQTIQCDLYVQASASGGIAMTPAGGSVTVSFGSLRVEDNALPATLSPARLLGSDFREVSVGGGEILSVIRSGGN